MSQAEDRAALPSTSGGGCNPLCRRAVPSEGHPTLSNICSAPRQAACGAGWPPSTRRSTTCSATCSTTCSATRLRPLRPILTAARSGSSADAAQGRSRRAPRTVCRPSAPRPAPPRATALAERRVASERRAPPRATALAERRVASERRAPPRATALAERRVASERRAPPGSVVVERLAVPTRDAMSAVSGATAPEGSPLGVLEPEPAIAISTAMNVPRPSTTQMTSSANTCGLARRKRIRACTRRMLPAAGTGHGSRRAKRDRLGHGDGRPGFRLRALG